MVAGSHGSNVFLGADLTPGVKAQDLQGLVNAAGTILNQVDANRFDVRAKGLAAEVLSTKPDLVGLQEVALWRTEPCTESPIPPHATQTRCDFLKLLLDQLNKGRKRYRLIISRPEVRLRGVGEHGRQPGDRRPRMPSRQRDQRTPDHA